MLDTTARVNGEAVVLLEDAIAILAAKERDLRNIEGQDIGGASLKWWLEEICGRSMDVAGRGFAAGIT